MPFSPNSSVRIAHLKQTGRIVEVRSRGRYRVAVGDIVIECKESELESAPVPPPVTRNEPTVRSLTRAAQKDRKELLEIDLHGLRVLDALKLVEEKIDRAVLAGVDEVRLVHGIGSGAIRQALHELLARMRVVRDFKIDETNPGTTRVFL